MKRKSIDHFAFEDLHFAFDEGAVVFEGATAELPRARAVWVRAPGGRGRSTFLKILCGLLTPTSGKYLINGESVGDMSFEQFLPYRLNMGYGFDMGGLLNNRTLAENLILPLLYHKLVGPEEAVSRVRDLVTRFNLGDASRLRPFAVSGSQRKLACVLRAFVHRPEVVFLDEPLTGLKHDALNDLFEFVDESFASHGLKQVFFTSEAPALAQHLRAEELMISPDWFTTRAAA